MVVDRVGLENRNGQVCVKNQSLSQAWRCRPASPSPWEAEGGDLECLADPGLWGESEGPLGSTRACFKSQAGEMTQRVRRLPMHA